MCKLMEVETEVERILSLPIYCSKGNKKISIENDKIVTGQSYYCNADPDMSDIAVGFYEIIYGDILDSRRLLSDNGDINNCCFAGDTMNSYHAIERRFRNLEHPKKTDKEKMDKYNEQYHCLANFWILPVCLGRKSGKGNNLDSMDIFLDSIVMRYDEVISKHKSYYEQISNSEDFYSIHLLDSYKNINTVEKTRELYNNNQISVIIDQATKRIEKRATSISKSKYAKSLFNYFRNKVSVK